MSPMASNWSVVLGIVLILHEFQILSKESRKNYNLSGKIYFCLYLLTAEVFSRTLEGEKIIKIFNLHENSSNPQNIIWNKPNQNFRKSSINIFRVIFLESFECTRSLNMLFPPSLRWQKLKFFQNNPFKTSPKSFLVFS